jgi:Ala-tRNA(Pro) deacylase
MEPFYRIILLLQQNDAQFELIEHEPVFTSEQAANIRGLGLKNGAKSLLLKVEDDFIMFVLPGDRKLDTKKLKDLTGAKRIRFATPEEVEEITGTKIGAVYPFGAIAEVEMYVDQTLAENEVIAFNPGVHDKSIIMQWSEYEKSVKPQLVDISGNTL